MKLSKEELFYINSFDSVTGVMPKDCIVDGNVVSFVVNKNELAKALGKKGIKARLLEKMLKRKVEIFVLADSAEEFIKNAFRNIELQTAEENGTLLIKTNSLGKRMLMQNMGKFKRVKKFIERLYKFENVLF